MYRIEDYGEGVILKLPLPGLNEDDVEVSIESEALRVLSEGNEFTGGEVRFFFDITELVKVEGVTASMDKGVLEIKLPLKDVTNLTHRKIKIN